MEIQNIDTLKECTDVAEANTLLSQEWRVIAVSERSGEFRILLGRSHRQSDAERYFRPGGAELHVSSKKPDLVA